MEHLVHFGWFFLAFIIGMGLGAVLLWLRLSETIRDQRRELAKVERHHQQVTTQLDAELEAVETECEELRKHVVKCSVCANLVPPHMPYSTHHQRFDGAPLKQALFTCEPCLHQTDVDYRALFNGDLEEVN